MKKTKRMILLVVATSLATVGLTTQAESISKLVVSDLSAPGSGSILMTIYCMMGSGGNR
ncbi:MAG: hypothetical protein R6V45_01180 [Oceanipulchritudo sp.]